MAILNLSQYYTNQNDNGDTLDMQMIDNQKNQYFNNVNPMTGDSEILQPINTTMKEPILQGINSKTFQNDLTNDFNKVQTDNDISLDMKSSETTKAPTQSFGSKVANNAGGIASFGSNAYQSLSQTAQSDKEADMRTASLTLQGASLGASVGGVYGAAIGAVVGFGAGMLKKVPDRKKRLKREYDAYEGKLFDEINQRKTIAEDYQRQEQLEYQQNIKKAQMGLLNLRY